jgi:predicted patatin/cPLA2 family phospholipase
MSYFVSPIRKINGIKLLDGGISDAIPFRKSISDGNTKNVVVLTKNKGYKKTPFKFVATGKIEVRKVS